MKLSKDDLEFALGCAKSHFFDSANSDYPNKNDKDNEELFRNLECAAGNNTLEIEGYERVQWTKFDPNAPKTFPPKGAFLLVKDVEDDETGGTMRITAHGLRWESRNEDFATNNKDLKYWRPFPKPPVETEGKK